MRRHTRAHGRARAHRAFLAAGIVIAVLTTTTPTGAGAVQGAVSGAGAAAGESPATGAEPATSVASTRADAVGQAASAGAGAPVPDATRTEATRTEAARLDRARVPAVDWWSCDNGGRQECATVDVPLDYDEPGGATTRLAVLRVPAREPDRRIGTLFVNPGGPGGSATEMARFAPLWLPADVLERFDVVGVDPRGVGASDLVACFPDMRANWATLRDRAEWFPRASTERAFMAASRRLGEACSTRGAALAGAVSTANVARDHELLRRALGAERFDYLGFSYGTHLGAVYANLFPDRVGAMVLDGVVDPVAWTGTAATRDVPVTLRGDVHLEAEAVLAEALDRCAAAGPDRCVTASLGDPAAVWSDVRERVRATDGLDTGWGRMTYADLIGAVASALDEPDAAGAVDQVVSSTALLLDGAEASEQVGDDGAVSKAEVHLRQRLTLARVHRAGPTASMGERGSSSRRDNGGFPYENSYEAYHAPMCADSLDPQRVQDVRQAARDVESDAPTFGPLLAWQAAPCASQTWRVQDEDAYRGPFTARTATPVLVVGSLWDATTPYTAAERLAGMMPGARLLTSDSWGHTAYGTSRCVTEAVTGYLVTRRLPPVGTRCTGDVLPFTEDVRVDGEVRFDDLRTEIVDAARGEPAESSGAGDVPDHLPPVTAPVPGAGPAEPGASLGDAIP